MNVESAGKNKCVSFVKRDLEPSEHSLNCGLYPYRNLLQTGRKIENGTEYIYIFCTLQEKIGILFTMPSCRMALPGDFRTPNSPEVCRVNLESTCQKKTVCSRRRSLTFTASVLVKPLLTPSGFLKNFITELCENRAELFNR